MPPSMKVLPNKKTPDIPLTTQEVRVFLKEKAGLNEPKIDGSYVKETATKYRTFGLEAYHDPEKDLHFKGVSVQHWSDRDSIFKKENESIGLGGFRDVDEQYDENIIPDEMGKPPVKIDDVTPRYRPGGNDVNSFLAHKGRDPTIDDGDDDDQGGGDQGGSGSFNPYDQSLSSLSPYIPSPNDAISFAFDISPRRYDTASPKFERQESISPRESKQEAKGPPDDIQGIQDIPELHVIGGKAGFQVPVERKSKATEVVEETQDKPSLQDLQEEYNRLKAQKRDLIKAGHTINVGKLRKQSSETEETFLSRAIQIYRNAIADAQRLLPSSDTRQKKTPSRYSP